MQQPTRLISTPFAQEGEKTEIQNVTGEFDNSATYRLGFPPLTMQSIRSGGKPPKGTDFNGVLFDITENISFLCKGGRYQYNAGLSTLIGGYPEGSNLLLDDNVTEVVSTVAGNQNNPNADMTGWAFKPNKTTAENVTDGNQTQDQINLYGGKKYDMPVGGYPLNARVLLDDGNIVNSVAPNNTENPNTNMSNWRLTDIAASILATPDLVGADPTGIQDATAALNALANPSGRSVMFLTKGDFKTGTVSIPPNTICYMNGAKLIRKQYTNTPVIDVGENSIIVGAVVDGNKDVLGSSGGGLRDYGIRLASGSKAIFCVSDNNFKHGITARSSDVELSVSSNQQILFCNTSNNGFNPGPVGTADGINTANSNYALIFGCNSKGNSRTNFVGETYNTVTADVDITLSVGVRCVHCVAEDSNYNSYNFEKVTAPVVDGCVGDGGIAFRGSPNARITKGTFLAISAPYADNPTVSDCNIINNKGNNEIFYLTGKNPRVSNVDVKIGESVIFVNAATVYIANNEGSGTVEDVTVNRAYTGVRLNVANASKIRVDSADNVKVILARPEKSIYLGDDFKLEKGRIEVRTSAPMTVGYFKTGDTVINSFMGGSVYGWQCTTAGIDTAAVWQQIGIRGLTKAAAVANSAATDIAGVNIKINEILASLKGANHMS